ncbi:hypothetical protein ACQPYE_31435 [Actinosynnema sp. CA-299493]
MADAVEDADLAAYYDLINEFDEDDRYGSWDRTPLTGAAREIITIARPGPPPAARRR